jgi:allantoin racemase
LKVFVILPILKHPIYEEITFKELARVASKNTEIHVESLEKGPASIESAYDEALAVPSTLKLVRKAESEGYDAVIIDCMGDPGLDAAREIAKIPVVGPCQASVALASLLASRFSVVTILKSIVPLFHDLAKKYGATDKIVSVRTIEIPVLDLEKKWDEVKDALEIQGRAAVEQEKAEAIILGCTGMIGMADELQEALGVPVVDPAPAALMMAEVLVRLNLSHSKLKYPTPPEKNRII